jgi:type II secretory pathway component GspD/PulD (secretin)
LANANVVMRMGDTLILGGLSEKESTNTRDGVPGMQDIPFLQYLFSAQQKTEFQKSVLILITPRPANYTWLSDASKAEYAKTTSANAFAFGRHAQGIDVRHQLGWGQPFLLQSDRCRAEGCQFTSSGLDRG